MLTSRRGCRLARFLLLGGLALPAPVLLAADEVITVFPASAGGPIGITTGPDGNMWFTEVLYNVGRITATGVVTEFPIFPGPLDCSTSLPPGCLGRGIVAGPDGNVWFVSESSTPSMARISPVGVVTGINSIPGRQLRSIAVGSDGNLWTAPWGSGEMAAIIRVSPRGDVTTYPIPDQTEAAKGAYSLAQGPDGNIWFTQPGYGRIGRITPSGTITEFAIRKLSIIDADAGAITSGPDGALWFTTTQKFIGRITTDGIVSAFPTATFSSYSASGTCSGPDGNIWFAEGGSATIARLSPSGVLTEFPIPGGGSPDGIAAGHDGNIWFTLGPFSVGRVNLDVIAAGERRAIPSLSPFSLIVLAISLASAGFFFVRLSRQA